MEARIKRRRTAARNAAEVEAAEAAGVPMVPLAAPGPRTGPRAVQRAARIGAAEAAVAAAEVVEGSEPATPPPVTIPLPAPPPTEPEPEPEPDWQAEAPLPAVEGPPPEEEVEDDERAPGPRRRGPRGDKRSLRAARTETSTDASHYVVAPTAQPAQMRVRHYGVIAMFFLCVVVPSISYSWYLWTKAADQYESDVGFGSRTEETGSTFDFLGALGGTTQSGSKDMDILNQFIISQELVAKVDAAVDLKAIYSRPVDDPLNAFHPDGTIEDLVAYWQRMVLINYDNATGLMNLRIFAFDPVDAQNIAQVVLVESTRIINDLSQTAQADTTRYSQDVLRATEAKLAEARLAVLDFQVRNRIVDPSNAIANQLSVVSTLNQQLAGAQIELDMLTGTVPTSDPRVAQLNRRIEVIGNRIAEEQAKVGANSDAPGFATLMAEFERLKVDQDFAQQAYLSALAAHDQALTDAQHKTRYLATYVTPTLAESSTAPNRPLTAFMVALIGFLLWAVTVLVYYALRDRR